MPAGVKKTVLLIRHGQGTHNVPSWGGSSPYAQRDPSLTQTGRLQAQALSTDARLREAELVVVSPLSRAIETAVAAFSLEESPPGAVAVALLPLHAERWSAPCDEGRPKSELSRMFPLVREWDGYAELPEHWSPTRENDAEWQRVRVPAFIAWLTSRPERRICVVGHGAFFAARQLLGRHLRNCEVAELCLEGEQ